MSHNELRQTEPQVRMLLNCAREAIEHVGWDLHSLRNSPTGVFIGSQVPAVSNWRPQHGVSEHTVSGISLAMLANRVSFYFNLMGSSATYCTACSAGLSALHAAMNALACGDCDQALVGAVTYLGTRDRVRYGRLRLDAALPGPGEAAVFTPEAGKEVAMSRSLVETLLGAVVLAVAIGFLVFAYNKSGVATAGGYEVSAAFNRVDGISNGSDVRIGGIKVGTVIERALEPETFRAVLRMSIDETVELPMDSTAAVVSDGLLGGKFIDLQPGAEETLIKDGGRIAYTQSSLLLEELIGKFAFGTE